jgi:[acyl-carrier-protein] S-malonyltransferase
LPAARDVFDRADQILGMDLKERCFSGPEERLNQTDISQPAIFVTSVACFMAAQDAGAVQPEHVTAYAGLSLGEYTAIHLAGAISFAETLKLVAARGKCMQQAATDNPSGMVALAGADEAAAIQLCAQDAKGEVLVPANYNGPGQIVLSGSIAACERVAKSAEAAGFKAIPLKVAGAFHSPLMQSAADRMESELEAVQIAEPGTTVYSNVTAAAHSDAASIRKLLVQQITRPVRWEQTMQQLAADADARFVELAPGRVLTGLLKKINRRLVVESLATADALQRTA